MTAGDAVVNCPACGTEAPEGARFCPSCGATLTRPSDERRVVTVLFGDVVGFTSMSEARDPEQVKNLLDRAFDRLAADVRACGGRVDKIVGDAIVAIFGAPVAHEDDAERAVRAALRMQETLAAHAEETGAPVRMRIAVNTGEVLVGALSAGGDVTAMGDVVNAASRLQEAARPGEVLVGGTTREATRDVVGYERVGEVSARGREAPIEAYRVVEVLGLPGSRPRRPRAPLVGREAELGMLRRAVDTAVGHRRPHLLLLLGEAGVGKSRLAEEVVETAAGDHGAQVLEGRCLPYGEANPWWPVAEALRGACGIGPDDPAEAAVEKCRQAAGELLGTPDEAARATEGLLYVMGYEGGLGEVEAHRGREEALRSLQVTVEALARRRPVVFAFSELHWADDVVLEAFDRLLERIRDVPVVIVATARSELAGRWLPTPGRYNLLVCNLDPLDRSAAARLLEGLLPPDVPPELREVLLDRSGGNPLFLEELASLLGERGRGAEVPATLRGLVSARLDALDPDERAAVEDAAVVGRRGSLSALGALVSSRGQDASELARRLQGKDLLTTGDGEYAFKSDLVRDVAYETLTKAGRARRHALVGDWLDADARRRGREAEVLEQIAHHYAVAAELADELGGVEAVPGDIRERALGWVERAAARAEVRETTAVSVHLFEHALRLVGDEEAERRWNLVLGRARARSVLRELGEARADAEEVLRGAEAAGEREMQARALTTLGEIEQKAGDLEASAATLERAVRMWRDLGDRRGEADALRHWGMTNLHGQDGDAADEAITEALAAYRAVGDRRGEAWALQNLGWIAFYQGDHEAAEERLEEARALFSELGDFGGEGWCLGLQGYVRYYMGDLAYAEGVAMVALNWTEEMGDKWAHGMMVNLLAMVRLWQGRTGEALEHAREAHRIFVGIEDAFGLVQSAFGLSWALLFAGRVEEAFEVAERALGRTEEVPALEWMAIVHLAQLAAGIGDRERLREVADRVKELPAEEIEFDVGESGGATLALAYLQLDRAQEAVPLLEGALEGADRDGELAYVCCLLALAYAAVGRREDAVEVADRLAPMEGGTYLDRLRAHVGAGLAHAGGGRQGDAEGAFREALRVVDASGDVLDAALVRLARGRALESLGSDEASAVLSEAEGRLADLGVEALGWDELFRRAAGG